MSVAGRIFRSRDSIALAKLQTRCIAHPQAMRGRTGEEVGIKQKVALCNATVSLATAILSVGMALPSSVSAETVTGGDRPVIRVPRGGGRAAFDKFNCSTCHAPDGHGGQNEGGYGADLRVTKLTEQEIVQVLSEGRPAKGMPSFKAIIDDETMKTLAQFIKTDLRMK
jgi:mono/diheme cytochrome c family protein